MMLSMCKSHIKCKSFKSKLIKKLLTNILSSRSQTKNQLFILTLESSHSGILMKSFFYQFFLFVLHSLMVHLISSVLFNRILTKWTTLFANYTYSCQKIILKKNKRKKKKFSTNSKHFPKIKYQVWITFFLNLF